MTTMMNKEKYCRTCALVDPQNHVCQLNRRRVELDEDFCSKHVTPDQLGTCAYCGQMFMQPGYLEQLEDGSFIEFCHDCAEKFGTCHICDKATPCRLTDESYKPQIPIMTIKEIRRGNMVARQQVMNPDRIQAVCAAECECWDGEGCARRDFGCCAKYNQKQVK